MALVGYLIVFSFVTKPGQTLEFILWGTIVPLNFLVGYHCSIVASTPQPMAYASTFPNTEAYMPHDPPFLTSNLEPQHGLKLFIIIVFIFWSFCAIFYCKNISTERAGGGGSGLIYGLAVQLPYSALNRCFHNFPVLK